MVSHSGYTKEEISRLGQEWYEREIRAKVEEGNIGSTLAIDLETGDYEMDEDHLAAVHRLRARHPSAVVYGLRIGYPAFAKIGGGWGSEVRR